MLATATLVDDPFGIGAPSPSTRPVAQATELEGTAFESALSTARTDRTEAHDDSGMPPLSLGQLLRQMLFCELLGLPIPEFIIKQLKAKGFKGMAESCIEYNRSLKKAHGRDSDERTRLRNVVAAQQASAMAS